MQCLFVPDLSIGISDSQRPFVMVQSEIPDVVYIKEGEPLVFPCRVTNPDAKVSLVKVSVSAVSQTDHFIRHISFPSFQEQEICFSALNTTCETASANQNMFDV